MTGYPDTGNTLVRLYTSGSDVTPFNKYEEITLELESNRARDLVGKLLNDKLPTGTMSLLVEFERCATDRIGLSVDLRLLCSIDSATQDDIGSVAQQLLLDYKEELGDTPPRIPQAVNEVSSFFDLDILDVYLVWEKCKADESYHAEVVCHGATYSYYSKGCYSRAILKS